LRWEHPSPIWDITAEGAKCVVEVQDVLVMAADVHFGRELIDVHIRVTNRSERTWELANLFTCFAFYKAPGFNDPDLTRTYLPTGPDRWETVADLFSETDPGSGPFTAFAVQGAPPLEAMWLPRTPQVQCHPRVLSRGAACVVSADGQWVAGMFAPRPAYVFHNRRDCCIHADPLLGTVEPAQTVENLTQIVVTRGSVSDFQERIDALEAGKTT